MLWEVLLLLMHAMSLAALFSESSGGVQTEVIKFFQEKAFDQKCTLCWKDLLC